MKIHFQGVQAWRIHNKTAVLENSMDDGTFSKSLQTGMDLPATLRQELQTGLVQIRGRPLKIILQVYFSIFSLKNGLSSGFSLIWTTPQSRQVFNVRY